MAQEDKDVVFADTKRIGKLSHDGVFIYSISENRFTFLNAAIIKILEINKKLLAEEPALLLHVIPEEDHEYVSFLFKELLLKESLQGREIRIAQNKVEKTLSCDCFICADGSTVVGFVKDVSKQKKHEEYLINYGARKDAILDMVSQNLSTPLNLSKFTVELIEKALKEKKYHKLDAHLKLIRETTSESIRIIDDFLQEEHLDSPNVPAKATRFDVIEKIMIVLEKMKETHPDKQFRLKSEAKHLLMNADDLKFFQIIHNLLSNSVKFTKHNGVIETIVKASKDKVEIVIKDDGIGIPYSLQPFLFERQSRASRKGLNGEVSNGIGLYIVKKLMTMMGGTVSFESAENRGTKFILEFPNSK